ncbi:hypothetical protein [Photobacterium toruni]|uniref:hypothetical protein n=1 Tax=Photobacterium toruni TaxID=1935446 RepID=UPI00210F8590|nr:hypothetical protein [Photobacterium toruni]
MSQLYELVTVILTTVGGASVIIVGGATLLSKICINRILEKEKSRYSKELEMYRDQLVSLSFEHQIKFTKLHEERAEVIAQTYIHIRTAFNRLSTLAFQSAKPTEENINLVQEAINELNSFFPYKRIFIKYEIANKIDAFRGELEHVFKEFTLNNYQSDFSIKFQQVHKDLSGLMSEIELEFRNLLGESIEEKVI